MRIALVSPYSWTYPGGVTRHIEALAAELAANGHEPRILAPFDPDDGLSRRLHRGARPQRHPVPEGFVSLGRTVGIHANGAVSNMALTPFSVQRLRAELRSGDYDLAHIHEPVVPVVSWDALCSAGELPLVGTFHTYSENVLTNGFAAVPLGARRRMNRLHARIAVSDAAAWTARRFFGGHYRIIPNGVRLACPQEGEGQPQQPVGVPSRAEGELRILFIGQAVERKGLPVLLRAFEALREQLPATLTLVGAAPEEVAHMILDGRGVTALGKVSEQEKLDRLAEADVLCAPSLSGESFGMVLTEAFAASTPVLASDIPGYRDVVRDGVEGLLSPAGDALALAEALRRMALDPAMRERMASAARERAERFAWQHVAAEAADCYEHALVTAAAANDTAKGALGRSARRYGLAPSDLMPRVPAERIASMQPRRPRPAARSGRGLRAARRAAFVASTVGGGALAVLALERVGVTRVAGSLLASKPGLIAAGVASMCAAMFLRAIAWHAILRAAPTWRRARRRDAMQGTFIGVLMSATLPARLGEPSRALIVARRLGHARETLPIVLGTIVSQTLINLLALGALGAVTLSRVSVLQGDGRGVLLLALAPLALALALLLAPLLIPPAAVSRSRRLQGALSGVRRSLLRLREGLAVFRRPRAAAL
ncbi:MAG: glycosyltransferase, partial [Solirubrobacteraceae bacterium]